MEVQRQTGALFLRCLLKAQEDERNGDFRRLVSLFVFLGLFRELHPLQNVGQRGLVIESVNNGLIYDTVCFVDGSAARDKGVIVCRGCGEIMYEGLETDWDKMQTKWNVVKGISETFPGVYNLTKRKLYQKVLDDLKNGVVPDINPDLYEAYSQNLRKAVSGVVGDEAHTDMAAQFNANVSRFAAHKAYHATRELAGIEADEIDTKGKAILNKYNRWQAAEYNTAVARARTARQWEDLQEDTTLYPNLRWLPSRSATPREQHMVFWNRVWAKDDPFWNENTPGSLWNCKCDWEETDEPVTDGNPVTKVSAKGLEGNPGITGEIFTKECTYFAKAGKNRQERDRVEEKCETTACNVIRKSAKQNPLLNQSYLCEIDGVQQNIHFADWGISETAHSMHGKKNLYWIKNEVLQNPSKYFKNAEYVDKPADVDRTHNTRKKTLALKKKFKKYYYSKITLSNGQPAYLNIVLHEDGKYYLYTISKNITSYQKE